jgi:AcrR family transcriptional regulator
MYPMARPADGNPGATRKRIHEAAFRLFGRFGYDGVSMTRVAQDSGVTKAALYWHFESKQTLYADAMRQLVGVFEAHVFDAIAGEHDPVERLFAMFAGLERLVEDPRLAEGIAGYWLKPSTADVAAATAVQDDFEANAAAAIEMALDEARDDGALGVEGSTRDMARAFIALMEAIVLPLGHRSARDHRRLVRVLAHIFFQAHARAPELAARAARCLEAAPDS